ncbi:unnamed protein product [Microthlaspi erraticum]|uniref:F-box domain-containing protein n=1 Tax=Microthlaspi erraticum TaxID=1685480 RepID=A0A6D2IHR7_9BRAS|nr:unnamed protein product [Microthlaspi erraticum]
MTKSTICTPQTSFSSLPNDVVPNILARISRTHRPTLSLVSTLFRSLILSLELDDTSSRIEKAKNRLYVCVNINHNPNPRWFILSPIPKPIPTFPFEHPKCATILSFGSEIYVIGGFLKGNRSRQVLVLDCQNHQWRRLQEMRVPRVNPAADVIDGKIYVIGGSTSIKSEDWGEVYDPKTQTWETLLSTTLDLTIQKSLVPGSFVMGGKVYAMDHLNLYYQKSICLVETEDKELCQTCVFEGDLMWRDMKESLEWKKVKGLEFLNNHDFTFVENSGGGRRVTVWWKSVVFGHKCNKEIWCAGVSFERRNLYELWGFVKWRKKVFSFDGWESRYDFFLHSAFVTQH